MAIANAVNATQSGFQSLTTGGVWNGRTITAGSGISVSNGDGISGNPTISATGSGSGLGTVLLFDDFLGFPTYSGGDNLGGLGNTNLNYASSISSNSIGGVNSTGANPGVIQLSLSGARGLTLFGNKTGNGFDDGDFTFGFGECSIEWYLKLPTLSDGTNRYVAKCGFGNNLQDFTSEGASPNDGCWFSYSDNVNSGNWVINTKGNSGTTNTNTSTAADTDWHNYKVVVNAAASSVAFYIDGVEVSGSPITTNIPTDTVTFFIKIMQTSGSTGRSMQADFFRFISTLTTPRKG